jgi:hypothetical protein
MDRIIDRGFGTTITTAFNASGNFVPCNQAGNFVYTHGNIGPYEPAKTVWGTAIAFSPQATKQYVQHGKR